MHLVQLLIPISDNDGVPYGPDVLPAISRSLAERFGGVTAYCRSPAKGQWQDRQHVKHDDVIEIEVLADTLDKDWWATFRQSLEKDLRQKEILIRTHVVERL